MRYASRFTPVIHFGVFEVDLRAEELRKNGTKIRLRGQPFQILAMLLERPGEIITREELQQRLWPEGTFVDFDHSLNTAINKIREVLGDSAENPSFVETLARRGYRFIALVDRVGGIVPPEMISPEVRVSTSSAATKTVPYEQEQEKASPGRKSSALMLLAAAVALIVASAGWFYLHRPITRPSALVPMKVVRFTSYPGKERDPALSPDGKHLAFVWDGEMRDNFDIYVQSIGGEKPLRLTSDQRADVSPVWSPDATQIAFARLSEGTSDIYLIPSLGGHERKLTEMYSVWSEGKALDWSPDGKFLAAAGKSSPGDPYGLFLITLETGKKQTLTSENPLESVPVHPSFSPDGQTVAFGRVGGNSAYLVPVVGGQPRRLTVDAPYCGGAWTPDGHEIVYFSDSGGSQKLRRVSVHTGKPQSVEISTQGAFPSISQRGNRLAYVEQIYDTDIWRIEVPDSQGKRSARVKLISSSQEDDNPQYSPDGKKVVFDSDRSGTYESWVCDSDGRHPFRLVSSSEITGTGSPRWSPDGRHIVLDAWARGPSIFVVSPDGGSPRRLTEESADGYMPSWSNDGHWIYFSSNRTGEFQIWRMPVEGGQAVRVTKNGGFEALEGPDGRSLYYSKIDKHEARSGSAHLWKISLENGKETLALDEPVYTRYWTVTKRGIYFIPADWSRRPAIELFSFATGQVTQVVPLERPPVAYANPGLTISPDGRWILCALVEQDSSDIMLVENFR
jgi:Tol biopolymer transport system component/DNA-binding winged helix-turn-helix (wHTH) protein